MGNAMSDDVDFDIARFRAWLDQQLGDCADVVLTRMKGGGS